MSHPCWSLPHFLTSHVPQHAARPRDLVQEDTVHPEPLPQEPLPKTSANAIRSESSAKGSLSHPNCGNLRNNTPTISKLHSQIQEWSMYQNSESSDHDAMDQRSWDCQVNWRIYDIAIDYGANRFPWFRYAWCDNCVCIEKASQHADPFPKKSKCRRTPCSKIRPFLARKTHCLHDLQVFPRNPSLWSSTRTLRRVHFKFAEWRRPRFRR